MRTKLSSVVLLGLVVGAVSAQAQWVSQNFALQAGWNAIYLHVQPEPRALDTVFTNLPVDMVYKWQRPEAAIQFDVDPGNPFPRPGDWQTWYPPDSDRQFLSSFGDLLANQAYYIHVTNVSGCALNLKGTPVLNSYTWPGNAYSLYGLPVPSSAAPTFTDFFSAGSDIPTPYGAASCWRSPGTAPAFLRNLPGRLPRPASSSGSSSSARSSPKTRWPSIRAGSTSTCTRTTRPTSRPDA